MHTDPLVSRDYRARLYVCGHGVTSKVTVVTNALCNTADCQRNITVAKRKSSHHRLLTTMIKQCVVMMVTWLVTSGLSTTRDTPNHELEPVEDKRVAFENLAGSLATLDRKLEELNKKFDNYTQSYYGDQGLTTRTTTITHARRDRASMPTSCVDVRKYDTDNGNHTLNVNGHDVTVFCNQVTDGGGWTVIQRRRDNSVDFYRDWDQYEKGFGDLHGNFWLGLEKLHWLTSSRRHMLRVDLYDFHGASGYAKYNDFTVGGPDNYYRLYVSGYSGSAGDSLTLHNHQAFTTKDQDHDGYTNGQCANDRHGAWWYNSCGSSNLNGIYYTTPTTTGNSVGWYKWNGDWRSLMFVEMKIKPY